MKFHEQLQHHLGELAVTHKELAERSGLSTATISRYCSGERAPAADSDQIMHIADALAALSAEKGGLLPPRDEILDALNETVQGRVTVPYEVFLSNLKRLLGDLDIRTSELARGIFNDASHISKILSGQRRPGNVDHFIHETASYVARRFAGGEEVSSIARLLEVDTDALSSVEALQEHLAAWLGSSQAAPKDESLPHFLAQVDDFALEDYLKAVRFDEIKVPPAMPHLPTRKEYRGIAQMMESELDFMKTTVLSRSTAPCIFYSDMPLEEMAADPDFPRKYMYGMALLLKKGLHLNIIHDINRPFAEMMLGLESWIPLYMTGQISPYYLPAAQNQVFLHFLKVSGSAALEGTAIAGEQASGKYVLYRSREDVQHYRTRAGQLLAKALPLMDIYQEKNGDAYPSQLQSILTGEDCKMICSHLPLYFLPEDLLREILDAHDLSAPVKKKLLRYAHQMRDTLHAHLAQDPLHLSIPSDDEARFAAAPVGLALADLFLGIQIQLTHQQYLACLQALRERAEQQPNFSLTEEAAPAFHNINILIRGSKLVVVSKEKSPAIHFVIHHKKLVRAFRDFAPPIVER